MVDAALPYRHGCMTPPHVGLGSHLSRDQATLTTSMVSGSPWSPKRGVGSDEQAVRTRIAPLSGDSHVLDYVMPNTVNGWRVVDVLADGAVSRVAVKRSDFRRLLSRGGAGALAASLASKSLDLSDGVS
jgi:hypothetical protein